MPGRDIDSVTRDMDKFIAQAIAAHQRNKVETTTESVMALALAMFNDYRGNSPRGVAELEASNREELLKLEYKLFGKKRRRR